MALTPEQKSKLNAYMNQMSQAELNSSLQSLSHMRNWLYKDHYEFYLRVKDKLDDVWDAAKDIAKVILTGAGYVAATAVVVAVAPFYILGKIFGVIDD